MDKEHIKTYIIVIGIILIAVVALVKARDYFNDNTISGKTIVEQKSPTIATGSNIKRAEPTPTTCTPQQNCGSPTCGVATGRGSSCGCT